MRTGSQQLVGGDSPIDVKTSAFGELDSRFDAYADHHQVGVHYSTAAGDDTDNASVTNEAMHRLVELQLDAVLGVQVPVHRSNLDPQHSSQRNRSRVDERHVET